MIPIKDNYMDLKYSRFYMRRKFSWENLIHSFDVLGLKNGWNRM